MEEPQESKKQLFWRELKHYIKELIDLETDADPHTTIDNISKGVEFRGVNVWILVFAIVVASIGLNMNSTAVIIGAMLISPLMNPIMGLGLGVGVSDNDLIRKSLKNLLIMVLISLIASTCYFVLSPLSDAQSELLARTTPTIFDVLIALFGGLAGIVAASRKEQPFTVISGVAIATALMPPLCTAGFGLATLQFNYFFGAFYLFFINSFFIAFATFVMVRYLGFPTVRFLNKKREKIVKRGIIIFALVAVIPSCFIAFNVIKETSFNSQVIKFIAYLQKEEVFPNSQIVNYKKEYHSDVPNLTLYMVGNSLSSAQIDSLRSIMVHDFGLTTTQLRIKQTGGIIDVGTQADLLEDLIIGKDEELKQKEVVIADLTQKLLIKQQSNDNYTEKAQLIGEKYQSFIHTISIADVTYYNPKSKSSEIVTTIYISWVPGTDINKIKSELNSWTPILLNVDKVHIIDEI